MSFFWVFVSRFFGVSFVFAIGYCFGAFMQRLHQLDEMNDEYPEDDFDDDFDDDSFYR